MALKWRGITVGPFGMNAYLLWCDDTRKGILIDPGDEIERIADLVQEEQVELERIIITHAHLDHVLQASQAQELFKVPLFMHRSDEILLQNLEHQAAMVGLVMKRPQHPRIDGYLEEGDVVRFGQQQLRVMHGPGHSPGSIMLVGEGIAVVGDVLFLGSIGRTDLPGGSFEVLMKTIHDKLLTLEGSVKVLPGHGDQTTIGFERLNNPFLSERR